MIIIIIPDKLSLSVIY